MCCRSCAECSCDHRGIITRQNEIIARQERQIAAETARANHFEAMMTGYIDCVNKRKESGAIKDAEIATLKNMMMSYTRRLEIRDAEIAALRMPPCIEPLSNAARAALDVVCKRDADD